MSTSRRNLLTWFSAIAVLSVGVLAVASSPDVPTPPKPEHQRKSHIKLSGDIRLPASDWVKLKYNQSKVGDFVEYQMNEGKRVVRRKVEEVGDHTLVVEETQLNNHKAPVSHLHYSFELPDQIPGPGNSIRETQDNIEVTGRKMPTRLREIVYGKKPLERTWYADDVPLGGLVKHMSGDGNVKQLLTAYGRGK